MSKITHDQAREYVDYWETTCEDDMLTKERLKDYINQQERQPLIHFDNANHFRNGFYNAHVGTVEREIANKLERLENIIKEIENE